MNSVITFGSFYPQVSWIHWRGFFPGFALGSFCSGLVSDRFGRKTAIWGASVSRKGKVLRRTFGLLVRLRCVCSEWSPPSCPSTGASSSPGGSPAPWPSPATPPPSSGPWRFAPVRFEMKRKLYDDFSPVPGKWKIYLGMSMNYSWPVCRLVIAGLAWVFRDWHIHLQVQFHFFVK